ncbi:MAG TPA: cytochrome P450 [Umezawaea sp.]|nr:cytochrome P450 [Umezawaea sp.]
MTEPVTYPFSEPERLEVDPNYAVTQNGAGLTRVQLPYGTPAYIATRYEDVKSVLSDPRFSRELAVGEDEPRVMPYVHRPDALTTMDPPRHSRLRRVVSKAFSARRIEALRPSTQQIVDALLDRMQADGGPVDLMRSYALEVPMLVVCELLGVPYEDRDRFHDWSAVLASTASSGVGVEELQRANEDLRGYLGKLIAQRRAEPAEDLLSVLAEAHDTDDRLTEDEMVSLAWSVLLAGYEITAYEIGNFAYTLLTSPDHLARLVEDPDLVERAVEELLRQVPLTSASFYPRRASEDLELGGTTVKKGEAVLPSMMAANRDEAAFPDAARLDFDREANAHLAFSHGIHHCLGAQLARMELQVVVKSLIGRFPGLRLAVDPSDVPWRKGSILRGPLTLMVAW